jgi:hypothetical protein
VGVAVPASAQAAKYEVNHSATAAGERVPFIGWGSLEFFMVEQPIDFGELQRRRGRRHLDAEDGERPAAASIEAHIHRLGPAVNLPVTTMGKRT